MSAFERVRHKPLRGLVRAIQATETSVPADRQPVSDDKLARMSEPLMGHIASGAILLDHESAPLVANFLDVQHRRLQKHKGKQRRRRRR